MKMTAKAPSLARAMTAEARLACEQHREELLDEALKETFPASDPPSIARPPATRC